MSKSKIITILAFLGMTSLSASAQMTGITYEVDTIFSVGAMDDWGNSLEGFVTYDFFAEFTNPTDELGAIYTDVVALNTAPMYVDAPCGCFNPEVGDVLVGGNQSAATLANFPSAQFDTYWTVGFAPGEQAVWSNPNYNSLSMCSQSENGGLVFTIPFEAQAAGSDLRIQFAQITTCGAIELHTCFQVYVDGNHSPYQEWCMDGDGNGPLTVPAMNTVPGCMDEIACNYNPEAGIEDGTCVYPGCTDEASCNYDAAAGCDDGSCLPLGAPVGCIDESACNYNPNAVCPDDSCIYPLMGNDCEAGSVACGETATWNVELQQCGCEVDPIGNCSTDLNGNGLVEVTDLLLLLGDFGLECEE